MPNFKLAIDAGHGADNRKPGVYDPGACAAGLAEADIALAWALTIKHIFKQAGIEVFLTRDDDTDKTPVSRRDNAAVAAGCTHFLSLHCNAGGGTGCETFHRDDREWAGMVQKAILKATGAKDRGVKTESQSQHPRLAVMDFPGEAALVELGFIDSSVDRKWLTSRDVRIKFAELLLKTWQGLR